MRTATSPTKGRATKTGSKRDASCGDGQKDEGQGAMVAKAMKSIGRTSSQSQKGRREVPSRTGCSLLEKCKGLGLEVCTFFMALARQNM